MNNINNAMKKLQESKRAQLRNKKSTKFIKESKRAQLKNKRSTKFIKESIDKPMDKKYSYKVTLDNGKVITATCLKKDLADAKEYFMNKTYKNTKTGESAKVVDVEENGSKETKNEDFGSKAKELNDNDPSMKKPYDSEANKNLQDAATKDAKIVAEEFGNKSKELNDNDPSMKKPYESETKKEIDDATKGKRINNKIDESKKLEESAELSNEQKLEKAKQLIEVIFSMETLDETRHAAKKELRDLVFPQKAPEETKELPEKKIVKESIFDNNDEIKVKEDRLADLKTQLECDGDQLADDEKEAIQAEIDSLEKDLYESKQLKEGTLGKTLEIIYTDKDGNEKTTHFECDKDYELDGDQIREAIKSSDNDIVDIIKINESKCLNEDEASDTYKYTYSIEDLKNMMRRNDDYAKNPEYYDGPDSTFNLDDYLNNSGIASIDTENKLELLSGHRGPDYYGIPTGKVRVNYKDGTSKVFNCIGDYEGVSLYNIIDGVVPSETNESDKELDMRKINNNYKNHKDLKEDNNKMSYEDWVDYIDIKEKYPEWFKNKSELNRPFLDIVNDHQDELWNDYQEYLKEDSTIEDIDDETFTEAFTKFIKENYKNAKEFKLENVKLLNNGNYKFECKLVFNSGKERNVNLISNATIKEGKSLIRFYENKIFKHLDENKSIMTATVKLENKTLSCESLRYNYRVALKENKVATVKGIIK